ncbi:MAG: TIGR03936 family radical SAM-associated protein [Lachnospiraceae bacterium]|nr:TIGR03936 family radical SAM-associated protein [Lachnospiraceae bacterium]
MKAGNQVLRIRFSKHGLMKYIGHLDVMRYFQKAVRRAGIDVAFSEGFSPHPIMSFAQPLGVGLESNGEYMDLEICSLEIAGRPTPETKGSGSSSEDCLTASAGPTPDTEGTGSSLEDCQSLGAGHSAQETEGGGSLFENCQTREDRQESSLSRKAALRNILEALNSVAAEGIRAEQAVILPEKTENAMASVASASYTLTFRQGREPSFPLKEAISDFLSAEEVLVKKKTKKGERELNLRALVYELSLIEGQDREGGNKAETDPIPSLNSQQKGSCAEISLYMRVCASSGDNVKPKLLIQTLYDKYGAGTLSDTDLFITRENLYDREGKALIDRGCPY